MTEIKTQFLQPDTLWETHFVLLEDVEQAYRNYDTLKEKFGDASEITTTAEAVYEGMKTLRAAILKQITIQTEEVKGNDLHQC